MDVRCPQCQTLYELDHEQVGQRSVTLKCSQCQHVFRLGGRANDGGENTRRWMVRRKKEGDILYLNTFDTLHEWVMKRTVNDCDEISRTGSSWTKLGEVGEFQPLFAVVESIAHLSGDLDLRSDVSSILTPRADTPQTVNTVPQRPNRERVRTQMQYGKPSVRAHAPMRTEDVTKKVRSTDMDPDSSSEFEERFSAHKAEVKADVKTVAKPESAREMRRPAGNEFALGLGEADISHEHAYEEHPKRSGVGPWLVVGAVGGLAALVFFWLSQQDDFMNKSGDVVVIGEGDAPLQTAEKNPQEKLDHAVAAALNAADLENDGIWTMWHETASRPFYIALDTAYAAADKASVGVEIDQELRNARLALERGRAEESSRGYQAVLSKEPRNAAAMAGLGWSMLELGRARDAVAHFQRAIDVDANQGDAYIGLGTAQRQLGQLQEAHAAYDLYLGRFPRGSKASIASYQVRELRKQLGM